ncbi:DUF1194 domain-containing protein [Aestuariivirga sp.]|uniref:DUF1194 domain-containing protein n=1 Tax=Aestuariivirga sp. TaxID=2650926 RepID=UPI00391B46CE
MMRRIGRFVLRAGAACAAAALSGTVALAQGCADVALVLAVDGSSSVDDGEYRLQQQAISAALRNADVLDAMEAAGSVAVAVVFWGDPDRPTEQTEPVVIEGAEDAERLARVVERLPRLVFGNTGLNTGLQAAIDRLDAMGCAHRRVINVSGDGRGTILSRLRRPYPRLEAVRAQAEAAGITINALTISNEEEDLAEYYRTRVITGDGAFVMDVDTHADYAAALRRKLIREIAPIVVGSAE